MRHTAAILEELGIAASLIEARGLSPCPEAERLEVAEVGADGKEHLLVPEAAEAWRRLKSAARQAGHDLFIVSAYRSVERQADLIRGKLKKGQDIKDILCVSAPPGFSEHHTGRAVDLATPGVPLLEESFDKTPVFAWLRQQGGRFGFKLLYPAGNGYGYQYEPWHWCHVDA
jgi:D-alanyl-D-alanine carboxypeptidase